MAKFVLQPCKVLELKIVPTKDPVIEVTLKELLDLVRPDAPDSRKNVRLLRMGWYVGLVRGKLSGAKVVFALHSPQHGNNLEWMTKSDPDIADRIVSVYRVEQAHWDSVIVEEERHDPAVVVQA
jgi:hypothetical protein